MLVATRMSTDPETIAPEDYLSAAHAKMRHRNFHRLPVVKDGRVVGIITDLPARA
jgi:acetoin utilization protein AcuB